MDEKQIREFVRESNAIEGIQREPTDNELFAMMGFIRKDSLIVDDLQWFVNVCQPGAKLRDKPGLNVTVGSYRPPKGGPYILRELEDILGRAKGGRVHPYRVHHEYETLHPFMDGNGRSGRALWAWMMVGQQRWPGLGLKFLHAWYYQSLEHSPARI